VSPCPHCGALARLEPSAALRWRCGVCGGPVVPTEDGVRRSGDELADLVVAQRARAIAVGWKAAGVLLGGVALMAVGLAVLLWGLSRAAFAVVTVLAVGAAALAALTARRSGRSDREARDRLDRAWQKAAADVLRARGDEVTAAQLAKAMHTDEAHAEALLGQLSALGQARVDVRDDADLGYRIAGDELAGEAEPERAVPEEPAGQRGR